MRSLASDIATLDPGWSTVFSNHGTSDQVFIFSLSHEILLDTFHPLLEDHRLVFARTGVQNLSSVVSEAGAQFVRRPLTLNKAKQHPFAQIVRIVLADFPERVVGRHVGPSRWIARKLNLSFEGLLAGIGIGNVSSATRSDFARLRLWVSWSRATLDFLAFGAEHKLECLVASIRSGRSQRHELSVHSNWPVEIHGLWC